MAGNLKIVAEYGTHDEAHMLQGRLEEAGIPAFLDGETMASHFFNALGGVKVLVPEENAADAEKVIAEYRMSAQNAQAADERVQEERKNREAGSEADWETEHAPSESSRK